MAHRPMPRLILIRHGETEWSKNGRHTGKTDIELTPVGEATVRERAPLVVGEGKIIDPRNLCTVFVSPRIRAHKTFHLLFESIQPTPKHLIVEDCHEWDYGEYEGLKPAEIQAIRPGWSIWRDGCPGGESVDDMQARVDTVIAKVREHHIKYKAGEINERDVVIVAHGHFNRVLLARWTRFPLHLGTHFNVEPGGVAVLGYNHNNLDEPAINALNLHANLV
ncbi:phosphoglycerate mutase-like protein [Cylindrobasidium torrendii FP15055 ss-10]|uniref:Phosphoglycerate mutase-like protein n=1 Tax=Cylindrobasidium torrendii FP15055 ss-10 TaxID=1314674 RepID=A0A0D7B7I3_9AGAR|nr:phosphoglycerate mutase-like protein [Cylindrobasidium torrendii FP15055 ss-10]